MVDDEKTFIEAERQRLVYVAATRAMNELVVARVVKHLVKGEKVEPSIWSRLDAALQTHATVLDLPTHTAPGRKRTERTAEEIACALTAAESAVHTASMSSIRITTVTESAKAQREEARTYDLPTGVIRGLGAAWGRAVHRSLEALGRRRDLDALTPYLRAIARDEELGAEQTAELDRLVRQVAESDVWRRLFAAGAPMFEVPVMRVTGEPVAQVVTEGVIDAAALDAHGWQIVDWKTDLVSDDEWRRRLSAYEAQVRTYAEILTLLTGARAQGVIERVVSPGNK
jgi:ATP-dependent helicase/nuclease subunit A